MKHETSAKRRLAAPAALLGGGLLAGAVLAGTLSATAASPADTSSGASSSASAPAAPPAQGGPVDESRSQRSDEHLLTGDDATKVTDAALAKYPGATVLRVETDSDGVYEAHLQTSDGQRVTVQVGEDFAVTGTQTGGPGGHGGRGRPDAGDGDGPDDQGSSSSGSSSTSGT